MMRFILLFLFSFPLFSHEWEASIVYPDEKKKTYKLETKGISIPMSKANWFCEISNLETGKKKKFDFEKRSVVCTDKTSKNKVWTTLTCFKGSDEIGGLKVAGPDYKNPYVIYLTCK